MRHTALKALPVLRMRFQTEVSTERFTETPTGKAKLLMSDLKLVVPSVVFYLLLDQESKNYPTSQSIAIFLKCCYFSDCVYFRFGVQSERA